MTVPMAAKGKTAAAEIQDFTGIQELWTLSLLSFYIYMDV